MKTLTIVLEVYVKDIIELVSNVYISPERIRNNNAKKQFLNTSYVCLQELRKVSKT